MAPGVGCDRGLARSRGLTTLACLLAIEVVALVGSRLAAEDRASGAPIALAFAPPDGSRPTPPAAPARPSLAPSDPRPSASPPAADDEPPLPPMPADPEPPPPDAAPAEAVPRRVVVRDDDGRVRVARLYHQGERSTIILPDGHLGWPSGLTFTEEPFAPEPATEIGSRLREGAFAQFQVLHTAHYVVLFEGTRKFAEASGHLLESLYEGLLGKLQEKGFGVHRAEFPLVAVIFRDEAAFRAHAELPPEVQAYYNVVSNRIFLYENSSADQSAPDVAARRRPQTVAHEGTHQILHNIGLHPRLASWPPWLVEGLAEYFAPTTVTREGDWGGANRINPFHMATIRDLNDPLSIQLQGRGRMAQRIGRDPRTSSVEYLVTRKELNPTDYALAWALTYYLANKRFGDFVAYLKDLSGRPPMEKATPEQHLEDFRRHFGRDLTKLDRAFQKYLAGLKNFEPLPYYAVTFEQPIGRGVLRRAAMVSQSPAMIRQWIDEMGTREGGRIAWNAQPFPTKTRARLAAEQWMGAP